MYRPTVRYDDIFREYVDTLFHATNLDRNQIIRAALFTAAHSKEFRNLLEPYKKKDVPLPSPLWKLEQQCFWLEQCPELKRLDGEINDVKVKNGEIVKGFEPSADSIRILEGSEQIVQQSKVIPSQPIKFKNQGGIIFSIN
ncbi:hypothetical protein [Bacillus sp. V3B]|uniref:hypothetical protein n=1 Tax=Bacillus sp. V3B TaxID=2804915 RepID=UPI00210D50D2|nr:hypothetical protein [Bacillus sp. V3B]